MDRVTIEGLYSDFTVPRAEARQYGMNYEQYERLANTEIVPRKMIEMIIEMCEKEEDEALDDAYGKYEDDPDYSTGYANAMSAIRVFANSLLEQFEEESK